MAFFTTPNISVPILPPVEAQSGAEPSCTTESTPPPSDSKKTTPVADSNERYEYTVETFGVQV